MKTRHFSVSEIAAAAELLRQGDLVAFPTETVYGLGAHAMSQVAVQRIFEAKGRPSDNPLIVHIESRKQLGQLAIRIPDVASKLMDRFWPGPLTIVLPKRREVPDLVTAGLDTVAVRMPNHSIALELIRFAGVPLAAPSANRSGRPSATTWQAVSEDLDGRIAGLICGEPTNYGLESTVVDVSADRLRILRPGGITLEQLQEIYPDVQILDPNAGTNRGARINSPGLKYKHYQPSAKVRMVSTNFHLSDIKLSDIKLSDIDLSGRDISTAIPKKAHYIGLHPPAHLASFEVVKICVDANEYAALLFDFFRKADLSHADLVCCESIDEHGIGSALMDRLRRACQ